MRQITETFSKETIQKMKATYKEVLEKQPPGAVFRARTNDAVITAYNSGKVLFQGARPDTEASKWTNEQIDTIKKPQTKRARQTTNFNPPNSFFTNNHIGSDESGTGDYFGPVTACAVYVTSEQIKLLQEMGIQDSKAITDTTIKKLSKELVAMDIPYSLMVIHNKKYNELQASGWNQGKIKAMIHHSVIQQVLKKIGNAPYEGILVDQFCNPPVYINYLKSEQETLPQQTYFMTKAEDYSIAVAAGSVIARASFVNEMDQLSNKVGIELMKGASQRVDQIAAQIIREKGEGILPKIAKVHFANTKKAKNLI